jgi:hypothetical protein
LEPLLSLGPAPLSFDWVFPAAPCSAGKLATVRAARDVVGIGAKRVEGFQALLCGENGGEKSGGHLE